MNLPTLPTLTVTRTCKTMLTLITAFAALLLGFNAGAQTTLISASGDGGFANGSTFAANGWTASSGSNNPWVVGSAVTGGGFSGNSAYISNDGGTTNNYTNSNACGNYFYRDVFVPSGEIAQTLTFNWVGIGETTWDFMQVTYAPTSVTPTGGNTYLGSNYSTVLSGTTFIGAYNLQSTVQSAFVQFKLPLAMTGGNVRLIFSWRNDASGGSNPSAAVDNISLTSETPPPYNSTLLSPSGDGGFANGSTFAANGWTASSGSNNPWVVGSAVTGGGFSGNSAYISNDGGTTNNYTNSAACTNYFYRDIFVPSGESKIKLSLDWVGNGESTWDFMQVSYAPTSVIPTGSNTHLGSGYSTVLSGTTLIAALNLQTTPQSGEYEFTIPLAMTGGNMRLIFSWRNDGLGGANPSAALDNIKVESRAGVSPDAAPFNFSASLVTTTSMTVNWQDNSTNENGFRVYRSNDNVTFTQIGSDIISSSMSGTGTAYSSAQSSLTPGQTYYYQIKAYKTNEGETAPLTGSQATTSGTIYTWNNNAGGSAAAAANWTPNRTTPANTDVLIFDGLITSAPLAVTGFATATIGQLKVINNADVTLSSSAASTLTISGGGGDDFVIDAGSKFKLGGTTNIGITFSSANPSNTADISGTFGLATSGTGTFNYTNALVTVNGVFEAAATTNTITAPANNTAMTINGTYKVITNSIGAGLRATWGPASMLDVSGITSSTASFSNSQTFNNVTWNCTTQTSTFNLFGAASFNINGMLDVQSTGTGKLRLMNAATSSVGSINVSGGTFEALNAAGTLTVTGDITQTGGSFDFMFANTAGTMNLAGDFNSTGGIVKKTGTSAAHKVVFNGTSLQTITGLPGALLQSYVLDNAAGISAGGLTIGSGASLTIKNGSLGAAASYSSSSTLIYNTPGNYTASLNEWPVSNGPSNVTLNLTGTAPNNKLTVPFNAAVGAGGTLTLTAGMFDNTGYTLSVPNPVSSAISGGSSSAYVMGAVERGLPASAATLTFPVGKAGYNPFELINLATNGAPVSVRSEAFDGGTGGSAGTGISSLYNSNYWTADITSGASDFTSAFIKVYGADATSGALLGNSSTQSGAYDMVGGYPATIVTGTSLQTTSPALTAISGYYAMGEAAIPTVTITGFSPNGTACVNTARTVMVTVTPGASPISTVVISYSVDGIPQTPITMTNTGGNDWEGTIPTVTPANGNVTWSVTATDNLGITDSEVGYSYKDEPFTGMTITPTATPATVCAGASVDLSVIATKGGNVNFTVGNGATTIGASGGNMFYHLYGGYKHSYLFLASELQSAGFTAGPINSLSLTTTTTGSNTYQNMDIGIGAYAGGSISNHPATTNVYNSPAPFTPTVGVNTYNFHTPFVWDGTSNLVVSFCYSNNNTGGSTPPTLVVDNMGAGYCYEDHSDNQTKATICAGPNLISTSPLYRPQLIFGRSSVDITDDLTWNWTPGNVAGNSISVNPGTTTTYYATATDPISGCSSAATPVTVTVNQLPETPIPAGSTQCGVGIPAAFIVSDFQSPNVSTNDFYWYDAPTGGNLLQTGGSTYTGSISQTTNFYVSESNGTCQSARVMVTATVNPPDAVTATVDNDEICLGGSANLGMNQSGSNQTYTFSWEASPETGSGITNPTPGASGTGALMVTPTAAGTYTYTITAVDGGCTTQSTIDVVVNALPVLYPATASPAAICAGNNSTLTALTDDIAPGVVQLGTGQSTSSDGGITPFYNLYYSFRNQYLFRASELQAAGLYAGNITSLAFNITTAYTAYAFPSYTIKISHTSATAMTNNTYLSGSFTTVYGPTSVTSSPVGWMSFTFSAPFAWDGTSNIVVEICNSSSNWNGSATVATSTTSFNSTMGRYNDVSPADACTYTAWTNGGTASTTRPDVKFGGQAMGTGPGSLSWNWMPGNLSGSSVSVSPAATEEYTVTGTDPVTGCSNSETVTVTVNQLPPAPTANDDSHCGLLAPNSTVTSNSGAAAPIFNWYDAAIGGNLLQTGTSVSYTTPISVTTTWYVSEISEDGCEGPRAEVTETVVEADQITATSTEVTICLGESFDLDVIQDNQNGNFYDYTWTASPESGSGISGSLLGNQQTITPTAAGTYTYQVAGEDIFAGCFANSTIDVVVTGLPEITSAGASPATVCSGGESTLSASIIGSGQGIATIGAGVTTTDAGGVSPFYNYWESARVQYLFRASELQAQGLGAGNITSLAFNITYAENFDFPDYTIKMASTASVAMPAGDYITGSFTTVFGPVNVNPSSLGWKTFNFSQPFVWDGTSNVVVEICYYNGGYDFSPYPAVAYTTTPFNAVAGGYDDDVTTPCTTGYNDWYLNNSSATSRPNVRFTGNLQTDISSQYNWEWTPGNITGNSITVNPVSTTTYSAVATDPISGCSSLPYDVTVTALPLPATPTATPSTQCGLGVPTASVSGGAGTMMWYDAETGGTLLQTGGNTYATAISQTTSFWVAENDGTCESERVEVVVTVNQPDAITASTTAMNNTVCQNTSLELNVSQSGNTQSYVYSWEASPEAGSGITGSVSGGLQNIIPTAAGSYTYTVTGYDAAGPCTVTDQIVITVNPAPVISSGSANPSTVCSGGASTLTAQAIVSAPGVVQLGSGQSTSATGGITPFYNVYFSFRNQYLFRASELQAQGLLAGNINSLAFNITSAYTTYPFPSYTIKISHTSATVMTDNTYLTGSFTTVYGPQSVTSSPVGWKTFTFSAPFAWDGTSNIVVEICNSSSNWSSSATVATSTTSFNSTMGKYDDVSPADACTFTSWLYGGTAGTTRPDVKFGGTVGTDFTSQYNWNWTPGNYAGSTVGVTTNTTTTYSALATNSQTGCSSLPYDVTVTALPLPATPTATPSTQCGLGVPTASVSGGAGTMMWYDAETGGTLLQTGGNTYATAISQTTSFWVAESDGTCESERVEVVVTVTQPDAITAAAVAMSCVDGNLGLSVSQSGNNNNYDYTWTASPEAGSGISGSLTGGSQTVVPTAAGTYTYTVTGTDVNAGCSTFDEVTVVVNDLPVITSSTASPNAICVGNQSVISAESVPVPGFTKTVGLGNTTNYSSGSPFYAAWGGTKVSYLYTATELSAAGLTAGNINSVALTVTSGTATTYSGFAIKMGTYSGSTFGAASHPATTDVYTSLAPFSAPTGVITWNLDNPYYWDGVSNIVVQFCYSNNNGGSGTGSTIKSETLSNTVIYTYADNKTPALVCAAVTGAVNGSGSTALTSYRAQVIFGRAAEDHTPMLTWNWQPGNYNGSAVNVSPTTTTTYTVTATDPQTGCTSLPASVEVQVLPVAANASASSSTICVGQSTNLSSNATGGEPLTFSWNDGQGVVGTSSNITVSPAVTTTYTVTVTDACQNTTQSSVIVNVNPLPAASIAETSPATICAPNTQTLTAITDVNNASYQWYRNGDAISGANGATYDATQSGSYTVMVTNDDTGCESNVSAAFNLTVNPEPSALVITPSVVNMCENNPQQLTASGGQVFAPGTGIATGTSPTTSSSTGSPFYRLYEGGKAQYLVRANELTAMGMGAGSEIKSLSFNMTSIVGQYGFKNFSLKTGATTTASLASAYAVTTLTTQYSSAEYFPVVGANTYNFQTPFVWDGTSNFVVDVCWDNDIDGLCSAGSPTCWGSAPTISVATAATGSTRYSYGDNSSGVRDMCSGLLGTSGSTTSRPVMTLGITKLAQAAITWSPVAGLFTDAGATVAYNGEAATSVYASPSAGNYTYTASSLSQFGCPGASANVEVNVTPALDVSAEITGPTNSGAYVGNGAPLATYSITASNYSTIVWNIPNTALNVSGQGTTSISFNYATNYTGSISVDVNGLSPCDPITRTLNITCDAPAAPVISGQVNVCTYVGTNVELTYTAAPDANATSYSWVVPPTNVTVVNGQGTGDLTITLGSGFTAQANKQLRVRAHNSCGTSEMSIFYMLAQMPGTLGEISGPMDACGLIDGQTQAVYSVAEVDQAEQYNWVVPAGVTIINGQGTHELTVEFDNAFATSAISVTAQNGCGVSNTRSITISRTVPSIPSLISGPNNPCLYMPSVGYPSGQIATYSVAQVGGNTYTWTVPTGANIESGQGTNSITVSFSGSYNGGGISVTASTGCGTSGSRSIALSNRMPSAPSGIDIDIVSEDCPNRVYTYSLSSMPMQATSVVWTVPAGATIVDGQGTTSITVEYSGMSIAGNITAVGNNGCGNSGIRSLKVKFPECSQGERGESLPITKVTPVEVIEGGLDVSIFPNPSVHSFKLVAKSTDKFNKIQVRLVDNLGRTYKVMSMMPGETLTLGNELKAGSYFVEVVQGKNKASKRIIKL
ncbi:MAG: T9SS type A sorting domain-containing protein [Ferruginibacter sp.]|nr:T9SS type A sorting domain-containing protein [Ferruginibacter sp.]